MLRCQAYADVNLTAVSSALGLDDASAITCAHSSHSAHPSHPCILAFLVGTAAGASLTIHACSFVPVPDCTDRGWQYDGATQLFQPVPVASPPAIFDGQSRCKCVCMIALVPMTSVAPPDIPGLAQMETLSKHVTYLESKSLTKA